MTATLSPRLLCGISVYQDVVLDGRTVQPGARDCEERWKLIAPHLADATTLLDVGSNFGWFGLRACRENERLVVASVEADLRSAAVQRHALRSHGHARVCLLTDPAGAPFVERFAAAGQRFDAALCLNVLHWMRDPRCFIARLGAVAGRIIVEHPDPDEEGAGVAAIRRKIGPIGRYLAWLFPDRGIEQLGEVRCHRAEGRGRQVWLVDRPRGWRRSEEGLDAAALLASGLSWPPRSWWQAELAATRCGDVPRGPSRHSSSPPLLTANGLSTTGAVHVADFAALQRSASTLPEESLLTQYGHCRRHVRRAARWLHCRCAASSGHADGIPARMAAIAYLTR